MSSRDELRAAVGADIVAVGAADEVYCSAARLARLRHDFGLSDRGEVNLHVRVPRFDALPLTGRGHMPAGVVAADLAVSADIRTRRAGRDLIATAPAPRGLGALPPAAGVPVTPTTATASDTAAMPRVPRPRRRAAAGRLRRLLAPL